MARSAEHDPYFDKEDGVVATYEFDYDKTEKFEYVSERSER